MFIHINNRNDVWNDNETMMKWYVKQKIKHKIKLYLTHVSVRQMKEQHNEMKRSVKRRKKEIHNNTPSYPSRIPDLAITWHNSAEYRGCTVVWIFRIPMVFCTRRYFLSRAAIISFVRLTKAGVGKSTWGQSNCDRFSQSHTSQR